MTIIVDRRKEPRKSPFASDRSRFLSRIRGAVKKTISDKVAQSSITDLDQGGVKVPIPKAITQIPQIHLKNTGNFSRVFPGNLFEVGDTIPIKGGSGGGAGAGKQASPDGEDSDDDFVWLSQDEFLKFFFEGRQLPNMNKLFALGNNVTKRERSGYTSKGPAHKLDMGLTDQKRREDSLVLERANERQVTKSLLEQYDIYQTYDNNLPNIKLKTVPKALKPKAIYDIYKGVSELFNVQNDIEGTETTIEQLRWIVKACEQRILPKIECEDDLKKIMMLKKRLDEQTKIGRQASSIREKHLTYKVEDEKPNPAAKAVMVCKMDVSASMSQDDKNIAKTFFFVLYKFLLANYDETQVVFITHTTTAEEVPEEEFFYGKRSGGTIVSSCLEKELEIIKERFPLDEWNIYSAQASDGDNFSQDNARVEQLMGEILEMVQASYFVEVKNPASPPSELYSLYKGIAAENPKLNTASIFSPKEAINAFENFFPVNPKQQSTPKLNLG